jgi:hypothetical protein
MSTENESVIKSVGQDRFMAEFYQIFKELISVFLKLFQKKLNRREYTANFILWSQAKGLQENCRPVWLMNIDVKVFSKSQTNCINSTLTNDSTWSSRIYPWDARLVQNMQINKCDPPYNRIRTKLYSHLNIWKKYLTKFNSIFSLLKTNTLNNLGIEEI